MQTLLIYWSSLARLCYHDKPLYIRCSHSKLSLLNGPHINFHSHWILCHLHAGIADIYNYRVDICREIKCRAQAFLNNVNTLLRVFRPHHNVGIWEVVPEQVTTPFLALIVICTVSLNCNVEYCYVVMIWSLHFQTGATPLYVACQEGHLSVVEQLIAAKAVVNTSRKVGYLGVSVISKVQLRDCSKHSAKVHHQLH